MRRPRPRPPLREDAGVILAQLFVRGGEDRIAVCAVETIQQRAGALQVGGAARGDQSVLRAQTLGGGCGERLHEPHSDFVPHDLFLRR